jgi:hypothetical protein
MNEFIALQKVKQTHVLPLDHLMQPAREHRQLIYAAGRGPASGGAA